MVSRENRSVRTETAPGAEARLVARAAEILRKNDMGTWTKAAADLYPHQWSWDSAFIAIGLSHLDTRRAARELLTLFAHQWKNGKVPHIVFNPEAPPDSYFPGAEHWASATASPDAPPSPPYTSCLCQPPVHAIAALRILHGAAHEGEKVGAEASTFLHDIYPKLFAWHRYLATTRDPEGSGLVTIYHPWESGTDNSPRWDETLAAAEVGDLSPFPRRDLGHVGDPAERPTDADYDVRTGKPLRFCTIAGFAPLISGGLGKERLKELLLSLDSAHFTGDARLRWPLPPSSSPHELAPLVVARAGRGVRTRLEDTPGGSRSGRPRRLRGVLRAVHRRAPRLRRAILDRGCRPGLAAGSLRLHPRRGCIEGHHDVPVGSSYHSGIPVRQGGQRSDNSLQPLVSECSPRSSISPPRLVLKYAPT